jgi:hypothetical protein
MGKRGVGLSLGLFHDLIELCSDTVHQRWRVMLLQDAAGFFSGSCSHIRRASRFPRNLGLVVDQAWDRQLVPELTNGMLRGCESAPGPISWVTQGSLQRLANWAAAAPNSPISTAPDRLAPLRMSGTDDDMP